MMRTFLFTACFAYATRHCRQSIMRTTLRTACFTGFTSWNCHFAIVFFILIFYYNTGLLQVKTLEHWTPTNYDAGVHVPYSLQIQQLLMVATFACQFFRLFFGPRNFANTTDICTRTDWYQTTNNQVFVYTNQFIG